MKLRGRFFRPGRCIRYAERSARGGGGLSSAEVETVSHVQRNRPKQNLSQVSHRTSSLLKFWALFLLPQNSISVSGCRSESDLSPSANRA
ncbi:hypothetical protein CRG98_016448, partial [Punica granatum]